VTVDGELPVRGSLGLMVDRMFGRYFAGKVLSGTGIWVQNIVAAILMWDMTGSATWVGAISVVQFAGPLVLSPWAGALTDIVNRRRLLMAGRLLSGCAAASLAVGSLMGALSPRFLLLATALVGVGLALSSPAMQALVPALVPPRDLDQALALSSVVGNISRAVGPALGTALLLLGGSALAFGFTAVAHWAFAATLVGLRTPPGAGRAAGGRVLDGVRYLKHDRRMAMLLLGVTALGFGVDPILTLTPALSEHFGRGDAAVGAMASVFGAGALVAAMFTRTVRRWLDLRRLGAAGFGVLALGLSLVAATGWYAVALAGFALSGAGFLAGTTALNTRIQRRVPDEIRGRVMALWTVAFLGFRPVAAAINGVVADASSARVAVALGAVVAALAVLLARVSWRPADRRSRSPSKR
jgi:MFS family permease